MNLSLSFQKFLTNIEYFKRINQKKEIPGEFSLMHENKILLVSIKHELDLKTASGVTNIIFNVKVTKRTSGELVNTITLDPESLTSFLQDYRKFIDTFIILKEQLSVMKLIKSLFIGLKLNINTFRSDFIFYSFFMNRDSQVNIYTVLNDTTIVSRTLIHSVDQINIIKNDFVNNINLLDLHRQNVLLVQRIFQNNLSLFTISLICVTAIMMHSSRFWILLIGIIGNTLSLTTMLDSIFYFLIPIIFNISLSICWFLVPRIMRHRLVKFLQN